MATKEQVRRALRKAGGTWDENTDTFESPDGHEWNASTCHSISVNPDDLLNMPDNYDAFIVQIKEGISPCQTPDCEICEEE